MCGIAGIVGATSESRTRLVETMLGLLRHRGPDDQGIAEFAGAAIGCRRLAIIDVAHGQQPMSNEDGTVWAVQNGEIYNYVELRAELHRRGHAFRTDSDTEVLPHAYEEYGDDFVAKLRGMFAIALWDAKRHRLLLARDRLGKKPLVYSIDRAGIAFASEIQALLAIGVDRSVDEESIRSYLQFGYVLPPRSGFAAIRKIRPGEILTFSDGVSCERVYWRTSYEPKLEIDEPSAIEELRSRLNEAVRLRMRSDVPLGVFLSGGLDSSSVVAFMAANADRPVKTFSVGFRESDFDELAYARLVAERFSTDHRELIVEPSGLEVLPMLVRHLGEPFADSSVIPTYYVARAARAHVTVALNGDGGDELFAGYDRYRAAVVASRADLLPRPVRALLAQGARALPRSVSTPRVVRRARRFTMDLAKSPAERYAGWVSYFVATDQIKGPRLAGKDEAADGMDSAGSPSDLMDRLASYDLRTNLPGDLLVKMDIATMAASLEARSPFLDHEVVDFVTRLPASIKYRGSQQKYLLRRTMEGVLPAATTHRSKMGFGVPVGAWMRGPLKSFAAQHIVDPPDRGFIDRTQAARLFREHALGSADHTYRLWALLMLELWFVHVVDAPAGGPTPDTPQ